MPWRLRHLGDTGPVQCLLLTSEENQSVYASWQLVHLLTAHSLHASKAKWKFVCLRNTGSQYP